MVAMGYKAIVEIKCDVFSIPCRVQAAPFHIDRQYCPNVRYLEATLSCSLILATSMICNLHTVDLRHRHGLEDPVHTFQEASSLQKRIRKTGCLS